MPNHANDYVTGSEFKRWMDEESAFRSRIEKRMGDGFTEIKASVGRIETLQREANGRLNKAERLVAVMERDIEAIKTEDGEIDRTLKRLEKDGCHRYEAHQAVMGVLDGAASVADTAGDIRPAFRLPSLSRRQKTLASVGVSALLIPAVAELAKLATEFVRYLQAHP